MKGAMFLVIMVALCAATAFADFVPYPGPDLSLVVAKGQGFGNIFVLADANTTTATGYEAVCTGPTAGSTCGLVGTTTDTSQHADRPITLGSLGITNLNTAASQIVLIFNGNQTGGLNVITLGQLALGLWYDADGANFAAAPGWSEVTPINVNLGQQSGQGAAGYGFTLNATEAADAQSFINGISGASLTNIYLGGGFSAGCPNSVVGTSCVLADDGADDLKVASKLAVVPVPEPASILGLGTLLFLIGSRLRRKKA